MENSTNFSVGDYLMDKNGNEVVISSLEQHINPDGYEVVQLDVEPDDFYVGQTFLVHNKGSNDEPTYPSTKFTNQGGTLLWRDMGDTVISDLKTIQLANGSGNTAITNSQTSAGSDTMKIAFSTSGILALTEQTMSGTGFISFLKMTYHLQVEHFDMRFKAVAASSGDGTGTATISFTNNGVTNSDVDITLNFT